MRLLYSVLPSRVPSPPVRSQDEAIFTTRQSEPDHPHRGTYGYGSSYFEIGQVKLRSVREWKKKILPPASFGCTTQNDLMGCNSITNDTDWNAGFGDTVVSEMILSTHARDDRPLDSSLFVA